MHEAGVATLVTAKSERMIALPEPLFLVAEEGAYGTLDGHLEDRAGAIQGLAQSEHGSAHAVSA